MAIRLPKEGQKISAPIQTDTSDDVADMVVEAIVRAITPEGLLVTGRVNRMMTFLIPHDTNFKVVKDD